MSALYGQLESEKPGKVTRAGHHAMGAWLQTEDVRLMIDLDRDGHYSVSIVRLCGRTPCAVVHVLKEGDLLAHLVMLEHEDEMAGPDSSG